MDEQLMGNNSTVEGNTDTVNDKIVNDETINAEIVSTDQVNIDEQVVIEEVGVYRSQFPETDENVETVDPDAPPKKKLSIIMMLLMQGVVIIYTMASVCGKMAGENDFLSPRFILFYAAEIAVLAIYAILWQQIIKKVDLSVAYVNRSMAIMWSMIWAALFFGEGISIQNVIGAILVVIGTIVVNGEAHE